jgi:predicted glycoside hydrolase/deacetylase ChbG (UPF0249 family)
VIRLVVNADDLGLNAQIDEGILLGHRKGLVTSATLLATGTQAAKAVRAANTQGLAVGLHLCLTTHLEPAAERSQVRWLAPGGRFRKDWAELTRAWVGRLIPPEEVALEFRAQLSRARALGAKVDHLDAHQHLHLLPGLSPLVLDLAREEGLPVRWPAERPRLSWLWRPGAAAKSTVLAALSRAPTADGVRKVPAVGIYESGRLDLEKLTQLLEALGAGDHELACHPGLHPGVVAEDPAWHYAWEDELAALCSPSARAAVERLGIKLTTYGGLASS